MACVALVATIPRLWLPVVKKLRGKSGIARSSVWNFSTAETLVPFCNGAWCGQSPTNIKALLNFGYPPHKLKWYRGGMQAWEQMEFTTVALED
jgi:hypothetical protein